MNKKRASQVTAAILIGVLLPAWLLHHRILVWPAAMITPWAHMQARLSEWFMHLWGMHVWADRTVIWTDLYGYPILAGYHGMGVALAALGMAIGISVWRRYRGLALVFMIGAAIAVAIFGNIVRITLLIRFGHPPTSTAMAELLRDSTVILAIIVLMAVWVHIIIIESARYIRQQKDTPIPGTDTGALSEFPPFWHNVLRRYRPTYIVIPAIALIGLLLYAGRPARRLAIWTQLVRDMSAQGHHVPALQLGNKVAVMRGNDTDWQLQLIRIMLLANQPEQAREALLRMVEDTLPTVHAAEHALLYTYSHMLEHNWHEASSASKNLQRYVDRDPIWKIILLELAMAQAKHADMLTLAPEAARSDTQRDRIIPAVPVLESSGNWRAFLESTRWMNWENLPPHSLHMQILAQLQLGHTSEAAERTQFLLQRDLVELDVITSALVLTRLAPTEWEPRLARLLQQAIRHHTDNPEALASIIQAAFSANRPDFAWIAYRQLRQRDPDCLFADVLLVRHAEDWFRFRSHALRLPAASEMATTDLLPLILVGQHIPLFRPTVSSIPHTGEDAILLKDDLWMQHRQTTVRTRLAQNPDKLERHPQLRILYADMLERESDLDETDRQLSLLAEQHPDYDAFSRFHRARLASMQGNAWRSYLQVRNTLSAAPPLSANAMLDWPKETPPEPIAFRNQAAFQLPLVAQLIAAQWSTRQYTAALSTAREAVTRFPDNSPLRTMKADILLQMNQPEEALRMLENTTLRRSPETDALEAEALIATGRFSVLPTFRRQRMLPPQHGPLLTSPPERLLPAEYILTPVSPAEVQVVAPSPDNPIYALYRTQWDNPDLTPDFIAWLSHGETRFEQADAMYILTNILHAQHRRTLAARAAHLAVLANPHEPLLWRLLLRSTPEREPWLTMARTFCPDDPGLWLAEIAWQAHTLPSNQIVRALRRRIAEARATDSLPVETLVRAADFLWRGGFYDEATALINLYYRQERGLLAAHLLGVEAAERADNPGRALHHIESAIQAAGDAAPELYARFIKSRMREGQIDTSGNVMQALRNLHAADPDNLLWMELLGYTRYQRGGADVLEASQKMRRAIQSGSTNRVAFLIAADGLRRLNRTDDAANMLRQGLNIIPDDEMLLNNLAYILAENPATATQARKLVDALEPLAADNMVLRETLAFVLLRNDELDTARLLLARNLQESQPDSRTWFRSQMHLSEIVWRQGRREIAISMLEQLLRGARNIPDEDVLTANRLLLRFSAAR